MRPSRWRPAPSGTFGVSSTTWVLGPAPAFPLTAAWFHSTTRCVHLDRGGGASIGATYSTAGVAIGGGSIAAAPFSNTNKVIVGANSGGSVYYWVGDTSGTGAWSASVGTGTAYCTAASASNFWMGGNQGTATGSRVAYRYKYSSGSWGSLGLPANYNNDAYIYGISDAGTYAGRSQSGAVTGGGARRCRCQQCRQQPHRAGSTHRRDEHELRGCCECYFAGWLAVGRVEHCCRWHSAAGHHLAGGGRRLTRLQSWRSPSSAPTTTTRCRALNSDGTVAAGYGRDLIAATRRVWIWDVAHGSRRFVHARPGLGVGLDRPQRPGPFRRWSDRSSAMEHWVAPSPLGWLQCRSRRR